MDEIAAKLLEELGTGIQKNLPTAAPATNTRQTEGIDRQHVLLVEMIYLLNTLFRDVHYWEGVRSEKDTFKQFAAVLRQLSELPGHDGIVRIRRRRSSLGKDSGKLDYRIQLGETHIEAAVISTLIKRTGIRLKHLEGRVQKACETLAAQGIDSLLLRLPDDAPESLETLRVAIRVLSCYRQAAEKSTPITFARAGRSVQLHPVQDERRLPDANLTMLAAVNGVSAEALQQVVDKVASIMQKPEAFQLRRQAPNIYQALFAIKSLRGKFNRPPLEVNSDRRDAGDDASAPAPAYDDPGAAAGRFGPAAAGAPAPAVDATGGGGSCPEPGSGPTLAASAAAGAIPIPAGPAIVMDDAVLKAGLAPYVKNAYQASPAEAVRTLRGLFAQDYGSLNADGLGERLQAVTRLLASLQANPAASGLMQAVLQRVQSGIDQLPAELLNDVVVDGKEVKVWAAGREQVVGKVGAPLAGAIDTAKDRAAARRKARVTSGEEPLYLARDASAVGSTFDLPAEEMEAILKLFRACFDVRGNFQKALFEKQIPEFARFHKKIFEVLWEFLKDMPRREDRLPYLNSLQLMIKEIRQPLQAVRTLLADFIGDPAQISYPDRNAIMLTIQFLRVYNKEINVDIELTPEEILGVKAGLDGKVVNYTHWKVNAESKRFLAKAVSIRKHLNAAFNPPGAGMPPMPARFLLALERELHIFLALAGGETSASILHTALGVFGNPEASYFQTEEGRRHLYALIQHLSVLIRAIGRTGAEVDLIRLDQIKQREKEFERMSADPRHALLVRRAFSWIDPARQEIELRLKGAPPASTPVDMPPQDLSVTGTIAR
jgi:hypothetical protein